MYAYFDAAEQNYLRYNDLDSKGVRPSSRVEPNPCAGLANESDYPHEGPMDFCR